LSAGNPALVKGLRRMARPADAPAAVSVDPEVEHCELCRASIPADHKHLLDLDDRRIVCTCSACWSIRSGDPQFRPAGARTLWLESFQMPEQVWSAFQIPIGLAFFLYASSVDRVVALYPSPVGATECELALEAWAALVEVNPDLEHLEPDCEALIVNRLSDPPQYAIAPIDECYRLVGLIKTGWEGISGGGAVERVVPEFFAMLRARALVR
jgi:hypothetical protein